MSITSPGARFGFHQESYPDDPDSRRRFIVPTREGDERLDVEADNLRDMLVALVAPGVEYRPAFLTDDERRAIAFTLLPDEDRRVLRDASTVVVTEGSARSAQINDATAVLRRIVQAPEVKP